MQLIDLFKKYPSKGKLHFLKIYEHYFKDFKNKKINILEIGVHEGKSLMIWKDYFKKANIVGIDLKSYNFKINRIFTFQGDQTDTNFLLTVARKFKKFSYIIGRLNRGPIFFWGDRWDYKYNDFNSGPNYIAINKYDLELVNLLGK